MRGHHLNACVCVTHLNARLAQTEPLAELLAHERVRIVRLVEQPLQLVQLLQREVRARSPLFVAVQVRCYDARWVVVRLGARVVVSYAGRGWGDGDSGQSVSIGFAFLLMRQRCGRWRGREELTFTCRTRARTRLIISIRYANNDAVGDV